MTDGPPDLCGSEQARIRASTPAFAPIGYVRSDYRQPAATPIQSTRNSTAEGRVEVFPEHVAALDGIADFDYVWLLLWLDRAAPPPADGQVVPFMLAGSDRRFGVFATRHPARPNPIGLSVVRVVEVEGSGITFRGVDACHGTPVLDIKPWEQHLDVPGYADGWAAVSAIRGGWYSAAGVAGSGQLLPGSPASQALPGGSAP